VVAERLRARQHRVSVIRRRVVAIAMAMFLASSGGIFVQLVSGNDPALAKSATKTAVASTASAPAASTVATNSSTTSSTTSSATGSNATASASSSPVTTSAS
jgi:cytoskeletal protein RodZ